MKRIILLSTTFVSLFFLSFFTCLAQSYKIGDVINDFSYTDMDGHLKKLSNYDDVKGVILIFTCNTCPYAIAYEDRIVQLHNKYAPKGLPVLAINPNDPSIKKKDSKIGNKKKSKEKLFTFEYVMDRMEDPIYAKFNARKTPEIFLLQRNKDGQFKLVYTGAIDDNYEDANKVQKHFVADALEQLLANQSISNTRTVAVGCSIKR